MERRTSQPWKLLALGLVAGAFGGGLGLGGGIIIVPGLIFLGLGRHEAHATSLAAIVLIATSGAVSFGLSGEIDVVLGVIIGIGGIIGSSVGASVMNRVSARALTITFAVVLIVAASRLIAGGTPIPGSTDLGTAASAAIGLAIGAVAGFFAGLAGVGGGIVIVPATVLLLGLEQHMAQGTSLLAIVFTSLAGTVVNLRNRRVRLMDGLFVGLGGVVGSFAGSRIALGVEARTLSLVFGYLVLFFAARSLYRVLRRPAA